MFIIMEQKDSITRAKSNEQQTVTSLEDAIERLELAARSIEQYKQDIETTEATMNNMMIDPSTWRGSKQRRHDEYNDAYKEKIVNLQTGIETIESDIEQTLQTYKDNLVNSQSRIIQFDIDLASIQTQIEEQRRASND